MTADDSKRMVVFVSSCSPYLTGERASFPKADAAKLVATGKAKYADQYDNEIVLDDEEDDVNENIEPDDGDEGGEGGDVKPKAKRSPKSAERKGKKGRKSGSRGPSSLTRTTALSAMGIER